MAQPGDELFNPITRQRLIFRRTTAQTGGELLEVESVYEVGNDRPPPLHHHPRQEERFEMLEGALHARVGREQRRLEAGEQLVVAPRIDHAIWNGNDTPARLRWEVRPALRTEEFFEAFWRLAEEGRVTGAGVPPPLHSAVLLREFRQEFRLARPPALVQALVFPPLAALGRALGHRAQPPYRR
jgi:mannose-6-phosphate isomerase-like protein (cupin superfamily)